MDEEALFRRILPQNFYATDALTLARELLGKILVRRTTDGIVAGMISETEAYMGVSDRASHAYGGRRTERTKTMYLQGGHAYVYLIYGIYACMNVTANESGNPEAVLIRRCVPCHGFQRMLAYYEDFSQRRARYDRIFPRERYEKSPGSLTDGPGKLCAAMRIDRSLNGADMTSPRAEIFITETDAVPLFDIEENPRIGVEYAGEAALFPWRFTLKDS